MKTRIRGQKNLEDYTTEELLAEAHRRMTYLKMKIAKLTGDSRAWQDVKENENL